MPFYNRLETTSSATIGTWKLTETEKELSQMLKAAGLTDGKAETSQMKVPLKRMQWMAARLLLKHLIPTFVEITYDQFGAPYIVDHEQNVSLSHSENFVAAILHKDYEVGIDVQVENVKLKRIATKFLSDEEMERYEQADDGLHYLHLLWSAKEAIFKIHRHHMAFKKIMTSEFDLLEKGMIAIKADRFDGLHEHEVHFNKVDNIYIAYSCYDPD